MSRSSKILLAAVALTLLTAVGVQAVLLFREPPRASLGQPLSSFLPVDPAGWVSRDLPLGNTESMDQRSRDLLNFDDFAYREYTRGGRTFTVYMAYWGAGKMPVRLVNAHTPDRCWTWGGWQCSDMRFGVERNAPRGALPPAEWRVFRMENGPPIHVLYWHMVGDRVHRYRAGFNEKPPLTVIFTDLWKYGLNLRREQFFVRLTSPTPFEDFWDEPGLQQVLASLQDLCLHREAPDAESAAASD